MFIKVSELSKEMFSNSAKYLRMLVHSESWACEIAACKDMRTESINFEDRSGYDRAIEAVKPA